MQQEKVHAKEKISNMIVKTIHWNLLQLRGHVVFFGAPLLGEYRENCTRILNKLIQHKFGWPFANPVDPIALNIPDYLEKIKHPMDFGTIQKKLLASEYSGVDEFVADVRLVFTNCLTYNLAGSTIHEMAKKLSAVFEKQLNSLIKVKPSPKPKPGDEISEMQNVIEELRTEQQKLLTELTKLVKKNTAERSNHATVAKPKKGKKGKVKVKVEVETFTVKQKSLLADKFKSLSAEDLQRMVEQFSSEIPDDQKGDGEMEIDLEKLTVPTLKKLDAFVDTCIKSQNVGGNVKPTSNKSDSSDSSDSDSSSSDSSDSESEGDKPDVAGGKSNEVST